MLLNNSDFWPVMHNPSGKGPGTCGPTCVDHDSLRAMTWTGVWVDVPIFTNIFEPGAGLWRVNAISTSRSAEARFQHFQFSTSDFPNGHQKLNEFGILFAVALPESSSFVIGHQSRSAFHTMALVLLELGPPLRKVSAPDASYLISGAASCIFKNTNGPPRPMLVIFSNFGICARNLPQSCGLRSGFAQSLPRLTCVATLFHLPGC